jgi:hypothetical protein
MTTQHPLEQNVLEQEYFERIKPYANGTVAASYRRVVELCYGSLPSWAERKPTGRKPKAVEYE